MESLSYSMTYIQKFLRYLPFELEDSGNSESSIVIFT